MRFLAQILLICLIMIKIVLGSILMNRIEIEPFSLESSAIASEPKKSAEMTAEEHKNSVREERIDLNFLIKKKAELKNKEEQIAKKKAEILALQEEINNKIKVLTQMRDEMRAGMASKKTIGEQKLKHLIKAYSAMKPQKAAALIEKLEVDFAVNVLANMKGEAVGEILSFIDIEKAAKISEKLIKRH